MISIFIFHSRSFMKNMIMKVVYSRLWIKNLEWPRFRSSDIAKKSKSDFFTIWDDLLSNSDVSSSNMDIVRPNPEKYSKFIIFQPKLSFLRKKTQSLLGKSRKLCIGWNREIPGIHPSYHFRNFLLKNDNLGLKLIFFISRNNHIQTS